MNHICAQQCVTIYFISVTIIIIFGSVSSPTLHFHTCFQCMSAVIAFSLYTCHQISSFLFFSSLDFLANHSSISVAISLIFLLIFHLTAFHYCFIGCILACICKAYVRKSPYLPILSTQKTPPKKTKPESVCCLLYTSRCV